MVRFLLLGLLSTWPTLAAPGPPYVRLAGNAVLLEEEPLPVWAHAHRALVLWVLAPADKPLQDASPEEDQEDAYTCPEQTLGHYYRAPTRVSLADTQSRRVLNTVRVTLGNGEDEYDTLFRIRPGHFYEVRGPLIRGAGKPHILALRDFNGDGKALEFAFYVKESCNEPLTMVLGYSQRQDRVIVYEFLIHSNLPGEADSQVWMYGFTSRKPVAQLHWRYEDWYNSGRHLEYDFRYVPERECFEGTVLITDPEGAPPTRRR